MESLLGDYRERERSGSDSSFSTASTPAPTSTSLKDPLAFLAESKPSRTRSASPPKRKIEETVEVSRAKRPKSDPLHSYAPVAGPSPTYSALQTEGNDTDPSDTGSVHEDECEPSTDGAEELLVLDKTTEALKTLLANWKEANMFVTELTRSTDQMSQLVEHFLSKTTPTSASRAATYDTPELTKKPTPRSEEIANEIVRRWRSEYGYAEILNPSLETKHNVNLFYLLKITDGRDTIPFDVGPTMWFILPKLREERENAYHTLVAHPYIAQKTASSAKEMEKQLKQEVADFFDKSFTYQVAAVHRVRVLLTGPLLRLGGDALFRSTNGINTGGEDYRKLDNYNQEAWQELVIQSAEMLSQNNTKQTPPMRSRGESSISSLGLTGLFLGDDQKMDYGGEDEANFEAINSSPKYREHRKDS